MFPKKFVVRFGVTGTMFGDVFLEMAAILAMAALVGALGFLLRQPLIIAFLVTGVLAGPAGFGIISSHGQLELLAHIGIALLLFVVGLRLDLNLIRTTGPVALATGIGQVVFTSLFGFLIAIGMGMSVIGALYVSVALTFSSTIIIVKLLSDKREIDALHGRIALGFLIVQDIVAIGAMIALTAIGGADSGQEEALARVAGIVGKGIGMLVVIGLLMRYVLPGLTRHLARSQELLMVFAVAWAVFLGAIGDSLGFSKEVGAFLGGVSLASTPYRDAIGARLVSLRDFLLLFFFIDLGSRLEWATVGGQVENALLFSVFVLVGNPLIVMAIMGYMGYRRRTGFLAGLTVAQISEFSLILAALGLGLGHIDMETMGLITLVGVVTICMSTYMIIYSGNLYRWLSSPLRVFERKQAHRELSEGSGCDSNQVDVVLVGLGNYGGGIVEHLLERGRRPVGADFDPQTLRFWQSRGLPVIYGDVGDPEFLEQLPISCARWVVSTVRDPSLNIALCGLLRQRHYEGKIALTARDEYDAEAYLKAGAHVVLRPFSDAAEQAVDALTEAASLLPADVDWPLTVKEVRLRPRSVFAGQRIRDLPLRNMAGISVVAVSRAGRVSYDPEADFQLFPGDRLVLMGDAVDLTRAEEMLQRPERGEEPAEKNPFVMAEVALSERSPLIGQTLADISFRQNYGITVVGILRGDERISYPKPTEPLGTGDRLIVIGTDEAVEGLKKISPP